MPRLRQILLVITLCLFPLLAVPARAQDIVQLHPGASAPPITGHIWTLYDETGQMPLEEALKQADRFLPKSDQPINLGVANPVRWLRLNVVNAGAEKGEWLLVLRQSFARIMDVYLLHEATTELLFSQQNLAAINASGKKYNTPAAPFTLAPGERGTLMIRYHGVNITLLPLSIKSYSEAFEEQQQTYVIFSIIAASVAAFAVYSSAIFMLIGGRAILYYAASEVALVLIYAQFNGILNIYLWPLSPFMQSHAASLLNAAAAIFILLFVRNFFSLGQSAPRLNTLLLVMISIAAAYLLLTAVFAGMPGGAFDILQTIPYLLVATLWIILPLLALYATARWDTNYWPLIPGWLSLSLYNIYSLLVFMNLLPEPPFHPKWLGFSIVVQAFFLAVAIVLQVRQLRDNRLQGQIDLNASLQRQLDVTHKNAVMLRELADQGRLVNAAGHDTRSILLGLRNFAAALAQDSDNARVSSAAQEITYLTDDLEAVLSTTMAGAVSGGSENILALEHLSLGTILHSVRLIHARTARNKKLRFSVHAGVHELVTDRALLMRIIGNLVDNACQYTTSGGIIVAARRQADRLRIQVWDSGGGIAPELLKRLLDPNTGPMRGTDTGPGLGSGLRIAKSLADRLGATLSACSRRGHGSRFELILPLAPRQPARITGQLWILHSDPAAAEKLADMARHIGVSCICVNVSGWDPHAIKASDLVLIDVHFGGAPGGIEIAKGLKARLPRSHIFICTFDRGVDTRAVLAPVAGTILYQPITSEALHHVLARAL